MNSALATKMSKSLVGKATTFSPFLLHKHYSSLPDFPEKKLKYIPTSGTYPLGFLVGSSHCGIKKNKRNDLAFIYSSTPCTASAVFTKNKVQAAPVQFDKKLLDDVRKSGHNHIRAVVLNSGVANAVTGKVGLINCEKMVLAADELVDTCDKFSGIKTKHPNSGLKNKSLAMSTGVIGQQLPIDKIVTGISSLSGKLGSTHEDWLQTATGFMTTDTFPKLISKECQLPSGKGSYRISGIAKGAGMIHPNMATLLGTVFTDASISQSMLDNILTHAVNLSFNSISVDGDTSTNDTIAILANGQASKPNESWQINSESDPDYAFFRDTLTNFMKELAILVVRDGEGATKFIEIHVDGAKSVEDAKKIAKTIATSPLVKTAFYGQDANWGRILCAVGYSEADIDPDRVSLHLVPSDKSEPMCLLINGQPNEIDESRASEILKLEDIGVKISLGLGNCSAKVYTCDLSHEYVSINGDYRS